MLNELPKPTIAVVHGACFGGGCGIACCVDVALATPDAIFGISEVRHGIAPTPISTHLVNAIGIRQARRYALTGERFGAEEALRIGLVHEIVPRAADGGSAGGGAGRDHAECARRDRQDQALLARGQWHAAGRTARWQLLAHEGWMQRQSPEGREGTTAFREKRRPSWYRPRLS